MTKRKIVVDTLIDKGFVNMGGAKHDRFVHPDGRWTTVPRHRDIDDRLFLTIKKQAKLK